jgi:hypothetical protein
MQWLQLQPIQECNSASFFGGQKRFVEQRRRTTNDQPSFLGEPGDPSITVAAPKRDLELQLAFFEVAN